MTDSTLGLAPASIDHHLLSFFVSLLIRKSEKLQSETNHLTRNAIG
jgi:hypothetical protein